MSILLKLDSSKTTQVSQNFQINYAPAIELDGEGWEISLIKANIWYSWYNISAEFGNNTLRYNNGSVWVDVVIPNGIYDISGIETAIHTIMKDNGDWDEPNENFFINFIPNFSTFRIRIEVSNNYQLDLTTSDLNEILGFNKQIITTSKSGENQVDITRGVNSLQIRCSIVQSSYDNDVKGDIIQSFSPNLPPGSLLEIADNNPIYLPIDTKRISQIRMQLTDQLGRIVDLNGEDATYLLHIRKVK